MPKKTAAKKMVRRNDRAQAVNRLRRSKVRAAEKHFRAAILAGDKSESTRLLPIVQSAFAVATKQGIIHSNRRDSKIARMTCMLKALTA